MNNNKINRNSFDTTKINGPFDLVIYDDVENTYIFDSFWEAMEKCFEATDAGVNTCVRDADGNTYTSDMVDGWF